MFEEILRRFQDKHKVKFQLMGEDRDLRKEVTVLNRVITWGPRGISIEADPKHAQEVLRALGMDEYSVVCTPGVDEKADGDEKRRQGRSGGEEKRSEEHQRKKD